VHVLACAASRSAGADGPHRLVGDDRAREIGRRETGATGHQLAHDDLHGRVRLALLQRLAHAHDRREPGRERGDQALVHGLVGLAEELAALGVPDDDVRAAGLDEHRGEISPVNAPSAPVEVLRGEPDVVPAIARPPPRAR